MPDGFFARLRERLAGSRAVLAIAAVVFALLAVNAALDWRLALAGFAAVALAALVGAPTRPDGRTVERAAVGAARPDPLAIARSISATLPDPLVLIDRNGAIVFQNEKADHVLGRRRRGLHISSALRAPEILEALRRVRETGETVRVDYTQQVPIMRHFEVFVAPIADAPGAGEEIVPDVLMIMRDLTQQERIERMRADFVAHASHELRTPLASLIGFVETLQGPARDDEAARERFLSIMQVEAARMSRLIDDLLSLSRIELNAHVLPTGTVDVIQAVHHVIDALAPLAEESGVTLNRPADGRRLVVSGDYDELIQVFQNLIENAIKYGQSGERVDIEVAPAAIDLSGEGVAGVVVSVSDYGPGIAAEHIPRLTERFYRVDVPQSREKGGTGLGLAIVKHILNRHRGALSIRSTVGSGSTFIVSLPLADAPGSERDVQVA